MLLIFPFISKLNLENAVLGTVQNMASSIMNSFSMAHARGNKKSFHGNNKLVCNGPRNNSTVIRRYSVTLCINASGHAFPDV